PLTPGSGADIAGRIIAQRLNEHWKQPVVVENRPGAGGQIGTAAVVKADPDGHTLLVQSSSHAANPAIYKNLPYDPLKDLADVPTIAEQGLPDYDMTLWFGMWAPAATPIPVLQKLNAAVNAIVFEPAVKEQFAKLGIEPAPMKSEDFSKFVRGQMDFYKKIVARAGIEPQ